MPTLLRCGEGCRSSPGWRRCSSWRCSPASRWGRRPCRWGTWWARWAGARGDALVVAALRVPRTVLGLLVGVALGGGGALAQEVTRNPLADPGLLGVRPTHVGADARGGRRTWGPTHVGAD